MATTTKSTTTVKVAATQFAPSRKLEENLVKGEALVREAARQGAQVRRVCEVVVGERRFSKCFINEALN